MTPQALPDYQMHVITAIEPQNEIWISCLLGGDDANLSYNESISIRLTGPFRREAMDYALKEVYNRFEILRATFSEDGREMRITEDAELNIYFEDIRTKIIEQSSTLLSFEKQNALRISLISSTVPYFAPLIWLQDDEYYYAYYASYHLDIGLWDYTAGPGKFYSLLLVIRP
jgi:hypothetical protein